jgi:hypothetical protein
MSYTKDHHFTMRIDDELNELRVYLKSHNVRYNNRLHDVILSELKNIAKEYNYSKKETLPF